MRTREALRQFEHAIEWPDGQRRMLSINGEPLFGPDGAIMAVVFSVEDITQRKRAELQLRDSEARYRDLAYRDVLTGLPNRVGLHEHFEAANQQPMAVLFLDLDRFKLVNDSLGHRYGDILLQGVAKRLREAVGPNDAVFRIGGDEFVICRQPVSGMDEALTLSEHVMATLNEPINIEPYEYEASVSVGVVVTSANTRPELAAAMRDADIALYQAKDRGRGCCCAFDPQMRAEVQHKLKLQTELRQAVVAGQLFLVYQPIVDIRTGQVMQVEALLRWRHPTEGVLRPGQFLFVDHHARLVADIGAWVLRETCAQAALWRARFGPDVCPIAVNVSAAQLTATDFPDTLRAQLQRAGLPPGALRLELTESAVVQENVGLLQRMAELGEMGIGLRLDDFGVGYSTLSYLHWLPIEAIKIDRSFVHRLGTEKRAASLIRSLAYPAQDLELAVVAEGVETVEQFAALQLCTVNEMQGYLISPPVDAAELDSRIAQPWPLPALDGVDGCAQRMPNA